MQILLVQYEKQSDVLQYTILNSRLTYDVPFSG